MKWSRYNVLFEREGVHLLYNSLSNSFVELSERMFNILFDLPVGKDCKDFDESILQVLKRIKAVVDSDELELHKIKYESYAHRFNNHILLLTINPTLACNFNCPYCFEGEHPNIFMTDEIENQLISYIGRFNETRALSVTWFGGEPLLHFNRIISLTEKMLNLGLEYHAGMITNGFLLTPKIADQLEKLKISSIQITLDGVGKEHDRRRCLKDGTPTYDTIVKNIQYIAENHPYIAVNIRVNIDRDNSDSFLKVHKELGQKYKSVNVHPAFTKDVEGNGKCASAMALNETLKYLSNLYNQENLDYKRFYPDYTRKECAVRKNNAFVVGPEGELYKCWNDVGKPDSVYGYINPDRSITNEAVLYDYLIGADQFNDVECLQCRMLPICGGGCPHTRLLDLKRNNKQACPIPPNMIEDYLWAHYCTKTKREI